MLDDGLWMCFVGDEMKRLQEAGLLLCSYMLISLFLCLISLFIVRM